MREITLGMEVKDIVTGFKGIVTYITTFLNGCVRLCVEPPLKKNGDFVEPRVFDVQQLVIVKAVTPATKMMASLGSTNPTTLKTKAKKKAKKPPGGARPDIQRAYVSPRRSDPKR